MQAEHVRRIAERALTQATAAKEVFPFRFPTQHRGRLGSMLGKGAGSSIEYHDHRPYSAGDDPRHIDWRVYARSGNYSMKLFREEIAPELELLLDLSASMAIQPEKLQRALELCYWMLLSAEGQGLRVRCTLFAEQGVQPISRAELCTFQLPGCGAQPDFSAAPLRVGSYRVVISDLLFAQHPKHLMERLLRDNGQLLLWVPYLSEEQRPDWSGSMQLIDCETEEPRLQQVDALLLDDYYHAYLRHFAAWQECSTTMAVELRRVPAEPALLDVLASTQGLEVQT
jgi:uncharacterized protein (DUF58 family)